MPGAPPPRRTCNRGVHFRLMRCDLYTRKSTADAGKSAARQRRDWERDCATEGYEQGQEFSDPDLSASLFKTKDRPDFERLIKHIESGRCQMIGMWEASRGSRTASEWLAFLELCRKAGTLIRVFGEGNEQTFNMNRVRDWRALADEGLDAHAEALTLSRRSKDGHRDAAEQGKPPGPLLFGYRRAYDAATGDRHQEIDPDRATVIGQLVRDTFAGIPLHSQARVLNARGVATSGSGEWTGFKIRRLLTNPGLAGHRVHLGKIVKENAWEGIITDDQHRQLVALLDGGPRRNYGSTELAHALSGAALCDVCGQPLRTERKTRYVCRQRGCGKVSARIDHVDAEVTGMIMWRIGESGLGIFAPDDTESEDLHTVRREQQERREYLRKYIDESADAMLPPDVVSRVVSKTQARIDELEARIREMTTPPALRELADVDVVGEWWSLPVGTRREVIMHLAEVRLSPIGRGAKAWSPDRLAASRFRGDTMTWGEHWSRASKPCPVCGATGDASCTSSNGRLRSDHAGRQRGGSEG